MTIEELRKMKGATVNERWMIELASQAAETNAILTVISTNIAELLTLQKQSSAGLMDSFVKDVTAQQKKTTTQRTPLTKAESEAK